MSDIYANGWNWGMSARENVKLQSHMRRARIRYANIPQCECPHDYCREFLSDYESPCYCGLADMSAEERLRLVDSD